MDFSIKKIYYKFLGVWQFSDQTGQQVARGSLIIFFSRLIIKGLYFIRTIILARLLFPDDFGLFGLATLTMTFITIFFQLGFASALIHQKDNLTNYLNTAWSFNILKNILMALVLVFIAGPMAGSFFHNANVVPLARALALVLFISGFENIGVVLFQKEFRFNRKFFYDVSAVFFEIFFVILMALFFRNAWALLAGTLIRNVSSVILSYRLSDFRPKLDFDFRAFRHLFQYGKWIGLAGIISFFAKQGDSLTIGRILDAHQLGIYQVALALGMLPATEISGIFGDILFPLYAKVQNNLILLKQYFIKIFRVVFAIIIPASAGIYVLAGEIVKFVYSPKWIGMVPIVKIVIIFSILESFKTIVNPLFLGIGKPKISTFLMIIQLVVMFALIIPLARVWGVSGVAWSVFGGLFVSQLVSFLIMRSTVNLGFRGFAAILSLPLISSAAMFFILEALKKIMPINNLIMLVLFILAGFIIYAIFILFLDKLFGRHYLESIKWLKKSI